MTLETSLTPARVRAANKVLAVLVLLGAVYVTVYSVLESPEKQLKKILNTDKISAVPTLDTENAVKKMDFQTYADAFSRGDLFALPVRENRSPVTLVGGLSAQADNWMLVGILDGAVPKAILEDKVLQKTFYLAVGETVNGFTVDEISSGTVVISREGQKRRLLL